MGHLKQIGTEKQIPLPSSCLLGRDRDCLVHIDDLRVSGKHASVDWVGDHWELKDLVSTNGTLLNGKRLKGRGVLPAGATFTLGGVATFLLEDASPPGPTARNGRTGVVRTAPRLLVLPDDDRPEACIFEDAGGQWVAEEGDITRPVRSGDEVIADGDAWVLDLPGPDTRTQEQSDDVFTLESISMRFAVSRDEEHIEVTLVHDKRSAGVPARTHHYLLLTLARAALADEGASAAERGWVDRELLCRMLGTDNRKLNVDVHRARKQLSDLGVLGGDGIVERRPSTGQIRLGTHRVEVTKL